MAYKSISQKAEHVSYTYNPEGLSPFPFENIEREQQDLKIFLIDNLPQETLGFIRFDNKTKTFEIFVKQSLPVQKRSFVIALELGHYFLHFDELKAKGMIVTNSETFKSTGTVIAFEDLPEQEKEAIIFASNLLMPQRFVEEAWNSLQNIDEVAAVFKTTRLTTSLRLHSLGLID